MSQLIIWQLKDFGEMIVIWYNFFLIKTESNLIESDTRVNN